MSTDLSPHQSPNLVEHAAWPLLELLTMPSGLKTMTGRELERLAGQIRAFLVAKVCASGGHLGVNLGVVELSIALHRVFDSPRDVLLFDTGHQAYVHKILTGRAPGFDRLRQAGGLSGYPSRSESAHDWIESSHAGTALSYADGIAKGFQLRALPDRRVVAVVGDGALTSGLAWEGLNNLAAAARPVIVVLNDNGRSYDPTVGGLARHLSKAGGTSPDQAVPAPRTPPGPGVFEQLGMAYLGPVDGHDIAAVETALRRAAALGRPVLVHCRTRKGRGYPPAERDVADRMHGIGALDPATGRPHSPSKPSWTSVFGQELTRLATARPDLVAMLQPVGLKAFAEAFPDRVFDAGIAEQHAICSAAGLAMAGLHPVVCLYATFLGRGFDQVLMEVALHRLPVTFVLDRAGITGPDGPSHHGMWDTALLALVPGLRLAAPRDPARLRELLAEAIEADVPTAIRFPKADAGPDLPALSRIDGIDLLHRSPARPMEALLVAAGVMAAPCLQAAALLEDKGVGVTVADPRWITPVSDALIHLAARHQLTITVEDATRTGGISALLQQACADAGLAVPVRTLGLPPAFIEHGSRDELLASAGLGGPAIASYALHALRSAP